MWLRGPRFTDEEFRTWIENQVIKGGKQLEGTEHGLLFVEVAGIRDATAFRDIAYFEYLADLVFQAHPHVAAISWVCEPPAAYTTAEGWGRGRDYLAHWNPALSEETRASIPLPGDPPPA